MKNMIALVFCLSLLGSVSLSMKAAEYDWSGGGSGGGTSGGGSSGGTTK